MGSTAVGLGLLDPASPSPNTPFVRLEDYEESKRNISSPSTYQPTELEKLENKFEQLNSISNTKSAWDKLSLQQKTDIENKKLAIMQETHKLMLETYQTEAEQNKIIEQKKSNRWWLKGVFAFLIVADLALMSVGGYFGMTQILTLISPKIPSLIVAAVSGAASLIEGIMMYSVLKPLLQRGLKITPNPKPALLVESYGKRLDLAEKMNSLLINNFSTIQPKGSAVYHPYVSIVSKFNKDINQINLPPFKEPFFKKFGRHLLSFLNTALSLAGAYFSAVLLVTAISSALIGTPVGWGIIAAVVLAQIISKFVIRQATVYDLLNSSGKHYAAITQGLQKFEPDQKENKLKKNLKNLENLEKLDRLETTVVVNDTKEQKVVALLHQFLFLHPLSNIRPLYFIVIFLRHRPSLLYLKIRRILNRCGVVKFKINGGRRAWLIFKKIAGT